jgi:plastocyanin
MKSKSPSRTFRKLVPLFLILAAFFMGALWVGIAYHEAKQRQIPKGTAHQIALTAEKAEPSTMIIKTGDIVQFTVKDGQVRRIGQGSAEAGLHDKARQAEHEQLLEGIQSEAFNDQYRVEFKEPGTYSFHDHINPALTITIIVFDPTQ